MVRLDAGTAPVPVAEGGLGTPRGVVLDRRRTTTKADGLGAVIGYAAAPGQVALDGDAGGNSPYAAALLKHLPASGFAFSDVMTMVTEEVYLKTGARQLPWTNASLRRLLYFGGSPDQAEDGDQALIRGERRKLLAYHLDASATSQRQQVVAKARQDGVPMDALFAMLRAVGADTPQDPEQLAKLLADQSVRLKSLLDERQTLEPADPEIARLSGLANEAVGEGALETAIVFRERAKERVAALSSTVDQAEDDLRPSASSLPPSSPTAAKPMRSPMTTQRAAEDFAKAYEQVARWDDALALRYKLKEARALSDLGYYKADEDGEPAGDRSLSSGRCVGSRRQEPGRMGRQPERACHGASGQSASARQERASSTRPLDPQEPRSQLPALAGKPEQTAQLEADLSLVLMTIGMREPGTELLEESAAERRQALKVKTRGRRALRVGAAAEPSRLGPVHARHSRAVDRPRRGSGDRLPRRARGLDTRRDPLAWANAENNLGLAIGQIGTREPTSDRLEEAVGLLKQALEVRTREIAPLSWAETLINLGGHLLPARTAGRRRHGKFTRKARLRCARR